MHISGTLIVCCVIALFAQYSASAKTRSCGFRCRINEDVKKINKCFKKNGCCRKYECPVGYSRVMDTCFRFVMSKRSRSSWADARDECLDWGGNLVTIDDKKKERFIRQHLRNNFRYSDDLKLFTGLIYTDEDAHAPYDPRHINHSQEGDSLRWTLTGQAVITPQFSYPLKKPRVAKYHPVIEGLPGNPQSPGSFLACVVLVWEPSNNASLTWRFNSCSEERLSFICEVRIGGEKQEAKGRVKRSDHDDPYLHIDLIGDDRSEGDDELHEENIYEEEEDI